MKKQLPGFILGFLCAVLLFSMSVSGYALITERTAIEVDPINVMVNGEVFQPRNAQGELVDVFAYNGTTYAPLRALAEAYGLEVGYDAEKNLATVSKPGAASNPAPDEDASDVPNFDDWSEEEEAAYQEFKALLKIRQLPTPDEHPTIGVETDPLGSEKIKEMFLSISIEMVEKFCLRLDKELYSQYCIPCVAYGLDIGGSWGWEDKLSENVWKCGYRLYAKNYMGL